MEYVVLIISASNAITLTVTDRVATPSQIGGVLVANYDETIHSSQRIAIDSSRYLHSPKLSINGKELTNSTTAEELNLKRADFVINVVQSEGNYIADKTFDQIQTAYNSGYTLICNLTLQGQTLQLPYYGGNSSTCVFQELVMSDLTVNQIIITESSINYSTFKPILPYANAINSGTVRAPVYDESTYTPTRISIDSNGYLHAPKSIFTVTVTANETADMTFEQIQSAYNNGYYVQASYIGRNIPLVQLTGSTAYFRLLVSEDTSDANLGMVYDIRITSTSVNVSTGYMRATSTQYGLIRADSDTYDETYTKECKMNDANGKLYCQPTMWSFWD